MHVLTPARNWAEVHKGEPAVLMYRSCLGEFFFIVCWQPDACFACYQGYGATAWPVEGLTASARPARGEDFPTAAVTLLREGEPIGEFEASISSPLREFVCLPHDGEDWERIDTTGYQIQFEPDCIHVAAGCRR